MRWFVVVLLAAAMSLNCSGQGLVWNWSNPLPHGNDVIGMAWNGTLGVQVCDRGQIYTSPDLINWLPQNSQLTNDLQAVTFFGNRIVVTGSYGAVAYSDDGVTFTPVSLNTANWIVSVAVSSTLAVAVGDNGALYTSANGAKWFLQSPPPNLGPYWLLSVAYGDGLFVTTGEQGYIAVSANGTNWTSHSILQSSGQLENVTWNFGSGSIATYPYQGFWAVSDSGDAFYSTNGGIAWRQFTPQNSTNVLYTSTSDGATGLLAGDTEVRLGTTASGRLLWPEQIGQTLDSAPPWTYFASTAYSNGVYALAGYDGMLVESYPTNATYAWTTPYFSARDWLWQVTLDNGLYVAVGDNARVMTSGNGADWTVEEIPIANSVSLADTVFLCVGGNTNLLIAAGTKGSLTVSPNVYVPVIETNLDGSLFTNQVSSLGLVWYSLDAPAGTTNDLAGVAALNGDFYLAGGKGTLLRSANGTNWTKQTSGTTNYLSGLAIATNGLMVATGDKGTILTSPDSANWTARASGATNWLYRVRSANGRLIAVGENGIILSSANATNWTASASGVTNWLNDVITISNTCYIVGNQGVVLASTNFVNWTNIGTIASQSLEGAATQNGQLIVVGSEGSILRSQVIPVTSPVNFISFAQSSGYNIFSVAGVVGQQFTLDSSTDLVHWTTGPPLDLVYGDGTLVFYVAVPANPPPVQYFRCTLVH